MNSNGGSSGGSETDIFNLIQEALKLAAAAVHFDSCNPQNLVGACDYYDKCILTIDEVLNKLPHNSVEWKKLLEIRLQYDDRMELLRERENIKYSLSAAIGVPLHSPSRSSPSNKFRKKKSSRLMFSEEAYLTNFDTSNLTLDRPPDNIIEVPYWTLRNVKRTITDGGFLTTELFVPKKVWFQPDVKFNGLSAKSAAFQIIVSVLTEHVETLYMSSDVTSLEIADSALSNVEEEFVSIQNQLSKSFNFIKENSYGGLGVRDDLKTETASTSEIKLEQTVRESEQAMGPSSTSSSLSMVSSFASTVTFSLVKNVKKYAEVGYQRLMVALPSRVTADDMIQFTKLVTTLCDKCQILDDWFQFLIKFILESEASVDKSIDQKTQLIINSLLQRLHGLSIFMRGILCEILMRDIEFLVERYLSRMRKTFSRMYWDDEK